MWNLAPPTGFQGLRDDIPMRVYTRHMPHWRQAGATYFLTFRLADSIPENRLCELESLKKDWERHNPPPRSNHVLQQLARMIFEKIEYWLDQGSGSCLLKDDRCATIVHDSLQHFHDGRYELGASVIMPNHAHCIVRPIIPSDTDLEDIVGSWKSFSARRINTTLGLSGPLWQEESYDRIIRDEEHLWRSLQYIGRNPKKANLQANEYLLWINPAWQQLGWIFDP